MYWYDYLKLSDKKEKDSARIDGMLYGLHNQIARQMSVYSDGQEQTRDAFAYRWKQVDSYETEAMKANNLDWLTKRYIGEDIELFNECIQPDKGILDAGCGSGFTANLLFNNSLNNMKYLGVDISSAVDLAAERFRKNNTNGEFLQADLLHLPFNEPIFDVVFSEGVLHYTDSTERAFYTLAKLIVPRGFFMFSVFKEGGPIREFSDDFIRGVMKGKSDAEAWDLLLPLTLLGKKLGDMQLEIDIPEAITLLNLPAGKIELIKLINDYLLKMFYKSTLGAGEMNHVNYNWYRPANCHRQTPEQVQHWCRNANLSIRRMNVDDEVITVIAQKL